MRHATRLLFASALVLAATRAGAQVPDNTPSLSDELLQLWNKGYTVESNAALDPAEVDEPRYERHDSGASPVASRSMTPNLDRLLGRSMDAAPHSSAPVAKDSPYGFAPRTVASKGGNNNEPPKPPKNPRQPKPPEPPGCDPPTPTPEPASMLLLGLGAGAAAGARAIRKRRNKK